MSRIERFEDIEAWKLARGLVSMIYNMTKKAPFAHDFGLRDQIQRAAVSTMANIAEGFERNSQKEFIQFLYMARGSCGEVRSLLYAALDLSYVTQEEFQTAFKKAEETSKAIYGFIKYLNR